ncbi:alpha/beta hydrolase [Actinomadura sp. ATCC 31491]|uniref:Alpha/beta hydrolase n=1 Tax=Actinomadura luzonensis TaxID=2805427 RepID=A0ABT0G4J1_9ACTN|nr:alpha/beta hydrolase [Actinomadura luzonensis]MCK2219031.1 alpha/beta hydrolase [Actinomadura luzonensis]
MIALAGTAGATTAPTYYGQRPAWSSCGGGFQCATLRVPLDYSKPRGRQIKISLIKLPATGKKIGSLVLNFGGPGVSGVDSLRAARTTVSATLRQRFDVVSFDPRGVGRSAPVRCFGTLGMDAYLAADATPDDRSERAALKQWGKTLAQACAANSGKELLAHVSTGEAARDLDLMRSALGDSRLTYLGWSYGTYLGARYADLYPGRIRAMVLDGAEDPQQTGAEFQKAQNQGFQVALNSFLRDCFKHKDCPFRKHTLTAAGKRLDTLLRRADRAPLRNTADGRQVSESIVRTGIIAALYSTDSWKVLRGALTAAFQGDGTTLLFLSDFYNGRRQDGTYDNETFAHQAISCLDHPETPCPYWPVKGKRFTKKVTAAGSPPIVVVGTTRDPATPYALARSLAAQLRHGVLLTNDGDGHTAYHGGSSCVERQVDRYLVTGRAPARDACHASPKA